MTLQTIRITGLKDGALSKDGQKALIVLSTQDGPALPLEFDAQSLEAVVSAANQLLVALQSAQTATPDHIQVSPMALRSLKATAAEGASTVILSLAGTPGAWMHFELPATEIDEFCERLQKAKDDALSQQPGVRH